MSEQKNEPFTQLEREGRIVFGDLSHLKDMRLYVPGGNCVFFAAQEAFLFHHGSGFGDGTLEKFQLLRSRLFEKYAPALKPLEGKKGLSFVTTLFFIREYFFSLFMDIEAVHVDQESLNNIAELGFDQEFPFVIHDGSISAPFIVYAEGESQAHVFFVNSSSDFHSKLSIHVSSTYDICTFIKIKTAEESSES